MGAAPKKPRTCRPAKRNVGALPRHLPRIVTTLEPKTTICPCCAGLLHKIGEDISEALDVIPAILRVLRTIRPKYGCRSCEGAVVQAKAMPRVVDGGMASTALVAYVVTAKFAWHLPLYRQAQMFAGQGIVLDRATLAFWVQRAAWWLELLYLRLLLYIRSQPRVFCDETPLPRLDPGRGRTKVCQLWSQAVDDRPWKGPAMPAVGYVFAEGRDTAAVESQLVGFTGILQVDGYAAYKKLVRGRKGAPIRLVFCLSHARRKFVAVVKTTNSEIAAEIIACIGEVYAIEDRVRGQTADARLSVRQAEAKPIMDALKARLMVVLAEISRKSSLAGAIRYTLGHWEGLVAFLDDGRIEVDTNTVERTMRPIGTVLSLDPSSSSICKQRKLVSGFCATRTTFSPDRGGDRFAPEIGCPDLVGSSGDDLLGGQYPILDQPTDEVVGDAQCGGGFGHCQPFTVFLGRAVGMNVVDAA